MAAKMTIQTRTQLPVYTAETLAAKNPVLLKGEIVYESDTGCHKLGDGTTAWNTLAYASDVEKVPALRWKVQGGMLYVKPATDPADPILKRCSVGILHYKNARVRKSSAAKLRPTSSGFKLVQDRFSRDELSWTSTRIDPIPFESDKADKSGWLPVISVEALFGRWVTRISEGQVRSAQRNQHLRARGRAGRVRKTKNVRIILLRRSPFRRRCPKTHRRTAQLFQSCCKQLRFDTVSLAYLNILVTGTQKV
jgi:hypothetical protein